MQLRCQVNVTGKLYNFEIMLPSLSRILNLINVFPSEEINAYSSCRNLKIENPVYASDKDYALYPSTEASVIIKIN